MRYLVMNLQAAMLFVACMLLGSCSDKDNNGNEQSSGSNKSIVILFESDSHCELSVGLPAGDIKKQDLMNMVPFEDQMYLIEVKGELLVNTLAGCTQNLPGFCGHFPQCSGIKYTVHQKSHTVTDVMVLDRESGNYQPLNMEKNYKVSLGVFYSSLGFLGMLKDCKVIAFESRTTRDAIEQYLTKDLKGQLGEAYRQPQGRITIVDD